MILANPVADAHGQTGLWAPRSGATESRKSKQEHGEDIGGLAE